MMRNFRWGIILLLALAAIGCARIRRVGGEGSALRLLYAPFELGDSHEDLLDVALHAIGMKRDDLGYRKDFAQRDPFRLKIVDDLLAHPLKTVPYLKSAGEKLVGSNTIGAYDFIVSQIYENPVGATGRSSLRPDGGTAPAGAAPLHLATEEAEALSEIEKLDADGAIPTGSGKAFAILVNGRRAAAAEFVAAFEKLTPQEIAFLREKALAVVSEDEDMPDKEFQRFVAVAGKVDRAKLMAAGRIALDADERAFEILRKAEVKKKRFHYKWETPGGAIEISGATDDTHKGDASILVDFGGNDRYLYDAAQNKNEGDSFGRVSLTIDLGGDDIYVGRNRPSFGAGYFGIDILLDAGGNDTYIGGDYSLGAGFFGVGVLEDMGGNDSFKGRIFTEGAGFIGVGMLIAHEGNDRYEAGENAQGYGLTGGAGLLLDYKGADSYFTGAMLRDHREEGKYYQSFAQGFGMGLRPIASGGIGLLVDGEGNDTYEADYFGQGSSYWYALGGLIDLKGNDRYIARRYCQGAGVHLSVGGLVDLEGDDNYVAWGVAQGVGHDLAVGVLYDAVGNDTYTAEWLSQGAGSANGIGIFADGSGDDKYIAPGDRTQGGGEIAREFPSVGIFIDAGGNDSYAGPGRNDSIWTGREAGVGVDGKGKIRWEE